MHASSLIVRRRAGLRTVLSLLGVLLTLGLVATGTASAEEPAAEAHDEHVSFVIDHADSSKGLVHGSFSGFELQSALIDLKKLDKSYAEYEIDLATIATGNGKRDAHLLSADFFEVAKFPTAKLRVDGIEKGDGDGDKNYTATATLSLRGIEKKLPVTFTVLETRDDGSLLIEGSAQMNRRDFGVGAEPEKTGAAEPLEVKVRLLVKTHEPKS